MTTRGWVWAGLLAAAGACNRAGPPVPAAGDTSAAPAPAPAPAAAAAQAADTADPCSGETSQMAIAACKAGQAKVTDSLEAAQYQAAVQWVKGRDQAAALAALTASEQAWKAYRDGQCRAEAALYEGGSLGPTVEASCRARENRARTLRLGQVYSSP